MDGTERTTIVKTKQNYVIEDGVPIPKRLSGSNIKSATSLRGRVEALEPGQSIFFQGAKLSSLGKAAFEVKHDHPNRTFTTRKVEGGSRIWRLT